MKELQKLRQIQKLNHQKDPESRQHFLANFDSAYSKLQQNEIVRFEDLVEFRDISHQHRFDMAMNEEI